jgi:hypothetical protein
VLRSPIESALCGFATCRSGPCPRSCRSGPCPRSQRRYSALSPAWRAPTGSENENGPHKAIRPFCLVAGTGFRPPRFALRLVSALLPMLCIVVRSPIGARSCGRPVARWGALLQTTKPTPLGPGLLFGSGGRMAFPASRVSLSRRPYSDATHRAASA